MLATLLSQNKGEPDMSDQTWLEKPYDEQAERKVKVDAYVTKRWNELDSIDIIDSIDHAHAEDLIDFANLVRDQANAGVDNRDEIMKSLFDIIDSCFVADSEHEV